MLNTPEWVASDIGGHAFRGRASNARPTVVDAGSSAPPSAAPLGVSIDYVLRVHRCEDGFTATLRAGDADPLATAVAATAREAMVAAIAAARINDAPVRLADAFDPPTL